MIESVIRVLNKPLWKEVEILDLYWCNFERGKVDKYPFIKKSSHNILLVQVYIDEIIF